MTDETSPESPTGSLADSPADSPAAPSQPGRRRFLWLTGAGAAVAAGAAGMSYWVRDRGEQSAVEDDEPVEPLSETGERLAAELHRRLPMLQLPEATVARWVNRHEAARGPWRRDKVRNKELQTFLLSTDFFPAADESKPLKFVTYYDPYLSVCYNPFRRTT